MPHAVETHVEGQGPAASFGKPLRAADGGPRIFRRRIRLTALPAPSHPRGGIVQGDLEDDQHRFGIALRHDGHRVIAVTERPVPMRMPWVQCAQAGGRLDRLVGMKLDPRPRAAALYTAIADQCTHRFDLAGLAVAQAVRGTAGRQYDIAVDCSNLQLHWVGGSLHVKGLRELHLSRDGAPLFAWTLAGDTVLNGPWAGSDVRTLGARAVDALADDEDEAEAIWLARRALAVTLSLGFDLDRLPAAPAAMQGKAGACYAGQPDLIAELVRATGNTRDFSSRPEALLAESDDGRD